MLLMQRDRNKVTSVLSSSTVCCKLNVNRDAVSEKRPLVVYSADVNVVKSRSDRSAEGA